MWERSVYSTAVSLKTPRTTGPLAPPTFFSETNQTAAKLSHINTAGTNSLIGGPTSEDLYHGDTRLAMHRRAQIVLRGMLQARVFLTC